MTSLSSEQLGWHYTEIICDKGVHGKNGCT